MNELINISIADAGIAALMGYLVVFSGLVMLMIVIMVMGKVMVAKTANAASAATETPVTETPSKPAAPGTAGELKLYDTDPRDAAMIMAIVADTLGKPLNELRFISIKEVKDNEI